MGAAVLGLWTLVGLVSLSPTVTASLTAGRGVPWRAIAGHAASLLFWVPLTPLILRASEAFPLGRGTRRRNLWVHLGLALGMWWADAAVVLAVVRWTREGAGELHAGQQLLGGAFPNLFSYAAVASVGHARRFHRLYVERMVREAELEAELLRAQLMALQMQLQPHFLFNALNTISGLIRTGEPKGALQVVAGLGELLRAVLRSSESQEVPLRQELEFVERYLAIERMRFQDRLRTRVRVEPGAEDALVPHLLLQPLVENAVRHGTDGAGGEVDVWVRREGERLHLCVRDSGAASGRGEGGAAGIGLANTRARLGHLYGGAHSLSLTREAAGGARAEVAIPFRPAGAPAGRLAS
jgi:hypothetical protein